MNFETDSSAGVSLNQWRRSSLCGNNACVEVAITGNKAFVRSSKDTLGAYLVFDAEEWRAFLAGVRTERVFDID
jgi:Domain of unknown function (DUF397)